VSGEVCFLGSGHTGEPGLDAAVLLAHAEEHSPVDAHTHTHTADTQRASEQPPQSPHKCDATIGRASHLSSSRLEWLSQAHPFCRVRGASRNIPPCMSVATRGMGSGGGVEGRPLVGYLDVHVLHDAQAAAHGRGVGEDQNCDTHKRSTNTHLPRTSGCHSLRAT
jgi:hypothetical protein